MRPSRSLPPVELWRGVRPRKAANSRPLAKARMSWIVAVIAEAVTGPTPGMVISRLAVSSALTDAAISLSIAAIASSSPSIWPTSGPSAARAGHGLDHLAGLSRRTADGLPQSGTGALAGQEARGLAERHRTPPRPDPRGCPPRPQSAARQDRNRVEGRRRAQQAQDGQTLRNDHRGRPLRLPPQSRNHRRGSRSRWLLCRAHQLADGHARRRRNRRRLQAPQRGRAGLPLPQDRGPGGPPHLPLGLAESENPCPFVHARLLRRTPYARQAGAAALRRHRPRSRGQAP